MLHVWRELQQLRTRPLSSVGASRATLPALHQVVRTAASKGGPVAFPTAQRGRCTAIAAASDGIQDMDDVSAPGNGPLPEETADNGDGGGDSLRTAAATAGNRTLAVPARGQTAQALRSVLKVFVVRAEPNYSQPWQIRHQRSATGSAFVLDAKRKLILTNAHVVNNANTIHTRKPGNAKKWKATLLCLGKVCDLALLTVEDDLFWQSDLMNLTFVEEPQLQVCHATKVLDMSQDSILVAGYPQGGDSLSITKGIVSRITMTQYTRAWDNTLLSIQIDAAINPGNSGGPAFSDLAAGKVAGVAFSHLSSADNIGYIIPATVVNHFLYEYNSYGQFRGVAATGFRWQELENTQHREFLQVPVDRSGILLYAIEPLSPANDVLQANDVLMEVDGVSIADDGTIEFRNDERVFFSHLLRTKHIGDALQVKLWRDGHEVQASYTLAGSSMLVPVLHGVDCFCDYLIVGGLVFVPLTWPFLEHAYGAGDKWRRNVPLSLTSLLTDYQTEPGQQVVVLYQVLAAELNFGYRLSGLRCTSFNSAPVHSLKHLAEMLDTCTDQFYRFELHGGRPVILQRQQCLEEGPTILAQHAIAFDRSAGLRQASQDQQQPEAEAVPAK